MNTSSQETWADRIQAEMAAAQTAWADKNDGRARACARRAVGILLKEIELKKEIRSSGASSAIERLRFVAANNELPEKIKKAAQRLVTNVNDRLSPDFTLHPINDAQILIDYFKNLL
jgi:hypothetical protein